MFLALAFVPVQDVIAAFETLIENIQLIPLVDYLEDTWIGRLGGVRNQETQYSRFECGRSMMELSNDSPERTTPSKRGILRFNEQSDCIIP